MLFFFFFFFFPRQGFTMQPQLSWNTLCRRGWPQTQRFTCLCLPSAGSKGVHHHRTVYRHSLESIILKFSRFFLSAYFHRRIFQGDVTDLLTCLEKILSTSLMNTSLYLQHSCAKYFHISNLLSILPLKLNRPLYYYSCYFMKEELSINIYGNPIYPLIRNSNYNSIIYNVLSDLMF